MDLVKAHLHNILKSSENIPKHIKQIRLFLIFPSVYTVAVHTRSVYNIDMIKSFADKETEKVFNQVFSKKLPQSIQHVALRKLILIDNAACLDDLKVPPGNRLEALSGDRDGQYSIRINDQYRICFIWDGSDFEDVEIVDYH